MDETVAILFTDIEGSSRLWERHPDHMPALLARHDRLTRDAVESQRGTVVKTTGDGLLAAFEDTAAAIRAAIDIQRALAGPAFSEAIVLRTRIGVHAGAVERRGRDLFGPAVNRAARIMAAAHGGQILISQAVVDALAQRLAHAVSVRELGTVRLRDLARPERIWQVVHPDLCADFPALRSLESTPNNLPVQVTSFVGREREQAEVAALLRTSRLVTLIGTGGLGKSRLSLQVGAEILDQYPDGVWLVELAPVNDGRLVAQEVAAALGVREDPGRPLTEALARFVSDRCLLLILDNCEHLANACAELVDALLAAGPRVSILASSREYLRIAGERVYPLSTLAIPQRDAPDDAAELPRYEAIRLFLDRAQTVQPAFRLTDANARPVVEICRRLDGIPLALELAAARLRTLQIGDIAARLDDRFRLLKGGSRTAEPRQQTLEALIDWSHDLLSATERALFRKLAVFAGGFTLAAAEAVGGHGATNTSDVVDDLSRLVEKSLVWFDPDSGRFRLLETVREYARHRLDEADDATASHDRHLAWYLDLFQQAGRQIAGGARSREWLSTLDAERENLLAAHAWCGTRPHGGGERGLEVVYASYPYWLRRGELETGLRVIGEALARPGASRRTEARCNALHAAGLLCCFAGSYDLATVHLEESQSIAMEIGLERGTPGRLQLLAFAFLGRGDWAAARACCQQAVALARRTGNQLQLASALSNLGQTYRFAGELEQAEALFRQSIALGTELTNRDLVAMNRLSLAMVALGRGALDEAVAMVSEAATIADELASHTVGQTILDVVAAMAAFCEAWALAARLFGASQDHLAKTGLRRDPVDSAFLAPFMSRAQAALRDDEFVAAERAGRDLGYEQAMASARAWLEERFKLTSRGSGAGSSR